MSWSLLPFVNAFFRPSGTSVSSSFNATGFYPINLTVEDTLGLKNHYTTNISKYENKEFKKVKGEVMNDYQNFLEENWITDLRNKSAIEVNKRQLKKLIKFYKKK